MPAWPALPYESWSATRDTLHAHTQLLGKLSSKLAPPEPQFQHGALRLTARGWETRPLPAPDGSGIFGVALDLHAHEAIVEHGDGRIRHVPLTPNRSVATVTGELLAAVTELAGAVKLNLKPQETAWDTPLDEDEEHATYNTEQVAGYLAAADRATTVLGALRAPYRGRATPVNAWWGSFDLAVSLFSGQAAKPPSDGFIERNAMDSQEIAVGWWPGDGRYPRAAFYGYAYPSPEGLSEASDLTRRRRVECDPRRVHPRLGRRDRCTRALPGRARLRPLDRPPGLRRVRVGPGARGELRQPSSADRMRVMGGRPSGSSAAHHGPQSSRRPIGGSDSGLTKPSRIQPRRSNQPRRVFERRGPKAIGENGPRPKGSCPFSRPGEPGGAARAASASPARSPSAQARRGRTGPGGRRRDGLPSRGS